MDEREKCRRFKAYHETCRLAFHVWAAAGYPGKGPAFPPLPDDLKDLTCNAKTRSGGRCKRRDIRRNGRCKFHGGMSTGPKTPEGKKRSANKGGKREPLISSKLHDESGEAPCSG